MKLILVYSLIQFPLIIFQFISNTNRDNISGLFGKSGTGILIQFFLYILVLIIVNKENFIKVKNFQFVFVHLIIRHLLILMFLYFLFPKNSPLISFIKYILAIRSWLLRCIERIAFFSYIMFCLFIFYFELFQVHLYQDSGLRFNKVRL